MAIRITTPSGRFFICDEKGAAALDRCYEKHRGVTNLKRDPQEWIVVDFGGAVLEGEEQVKIEVPDLKLTVPVGQFEDLLNTLERRQESKIAPGTIWFGGWMDFYYVIGVETRRSVVKEMQRLLPEVKPKIEAEKKRWENLK